METIALVSVLSTVVTLASVVQVTPVVKEDSKLGVPILLGSSTKRLVVLISNLSLESV